MWGEVHEVVEVVGAQNCEIACGGGFGLQNRKPSPHTWYQSRAQNEMQWG